MSSLGSFRRAGSGIKVHHLAERGLLDEDGDSVHTAGRRPMLDASGMLSFKGGAAGEADDQAGGLAAMLTVGLATKLSLAVNIFLLGAKLVAFILSNSKSVLAALVDSIVDILSQAVMFTAEYYIEKSDARYPVGRARRAAGARLRDANPIVKTKQNSLPDVILAKQR